MKINSRLFLRQTASMNIRQKKARRCQNLNFSVATPDIRVSTPAEKQRLIFVSPLAGRWIRQMVCFAALALLLTSIAEAAVESGATDSASNSQTRGQYSKTAHGYEATIAQQGYSAPALFNLANAQQSDGQLGQAILNYERARLLAPNDPDIAGNQGAARRKAGLELEHSSAMQRAARTLTMNMWFALATSALFVFALTWPLKLLRPQARRLLNITCTTAAMGLVIAIGALGLRSTELNRAVVVVPEAVAGVSPVTVAAPVFKLRAGEIVSLQRKHGNFALVRNQTGHKGWVLADQIEQVIPDKNARGT